MRVLGISGRKQAGKNTVANFLVGLEMSSLGIIRGEWYITDAGQLHISDLMGDTRFKGIFDITRNNAAIKAFRTEYTDSMFKLYSFADLLKQEVCIKIFGLSWEQCYGSDADKKTVTKLQWENMPGIITDVPTADGIETLQVNGRIGVYYDRIVDTKETKWGNQDEHFAVPIGIYHEPGPMTARDVLQYVGTEVFRKMCPDVWAQALIRQIQNEKTDFAIITDLRFPNEVSAVHQVDGKVLRLTRDPFNDQHDSETALDKDRYDWSNFDIIIDNSAITIPEQHQLVYEQLANIGFVPPIEEIE